MVTRLQIGKKNRKNDMNIKKKLEDLNIKYHIDEKKIIIDHAGNKQLKTLCDIIKKNKNLKLWQHKRKDKNQEWHRLLLWIEVIE